MKLWRNAWASLVHSQFQLVSEFEGLYDPIVGASDGHGRQRAPTPQLQLERSLKLKTAYDELRTELVEEVAMIEEQIVRPATEARDCIAPIRKTIKKRENKRLDYERLQEKATKLQRKQGRTPKEDAALSKAEAEMSRAADVSRHRCRPRRRAGRNPTLTRKHTRSSRLPTTTSARRCRRSSRPRSASCRCCSPTSS